MTFSMAQLATHMQPFAPSEVVRALLLAPKIDHDKPSHSHLALPSLSIHPHLLLLLLLLSLTPQKQPPSHQSPNIPIHPLVPTTNQTQHT